MQNNDRQHKFTISNLIYGLIKSRPYLFFLPIIYIARALAEIYGVIYENKLIDNASDIYNKKSPSDDLYKSIVLYIVLSSLGNLLRGVKDTIDGYHEYVFLKHLQSSAFSILSSRDDVFYSSSQNNPSKITSRIISDTQILSTVSSTVSFALNDIVGNIAFIVMSAFILSVIPWFFSFYLLLLVPFIIGFAYIYGKRMGEIKRVMQNKKADILQITSHLMSNRQTLHSQNMGKYMLRQMIHKVNELEEPTMNLVWWNNVKWYWVTCLNYMLAGFLYYMFEPYVRETSLTIGDIRAILALNYRFYERVGAMVNQYKIYKEVEGSSTDLLHFLSYVNNVEESDIDRIIKVDKDDEDLFSGYFKKDLLRKVSITWRQSILMPQALELKPKPLQQDILKVNSLKFSRQDVENKTRSLIFENVNFTAKEGSIILLKGSNGCGKSTLFSIMNRLLEPEEGCICFNGKDIRKIDTYQWRKRLFFFGQKTPLVFGTYIENIFAPHPVPEKEQAKQIIKDVVQRWEIPMNDVTIDELFVRVVEGAHSKHLSGGQTQKLYWMRLLTQLHNKQLVLLDEPTSAMDKESVEWVISVLRIFKNLRIKANINIPTVLLITHDQAIGKEADMIVQFENKTSYCSMNDLDEKESS